MKKLTETSPEAKSADLVVANIDQLKALFPELLAEGPNGTSLNIDVLKALVGDLTVTDADEKYGLNWHGKRRARQLALTPSTGTLRPCPEESVDWETTQNLMIEGDNLEVLKLLQKSYAGKVKLIYIDPPYNTGKDFVYPDNFQDNIKNYLDLTGQVEGGRKVSSNTEASGRFHTDWLNMMYPRLKLAKNLLSNDGVIFISLDDTESANLRKICDEIFGEENFVATFLWKKKGTTTNVDGAKVSSLTEYVHCYGKSSMAGINYRIVSQETRAYPFEDTLGKYRTTVIEKKNSGAYERRTMQFRILGQQPRAGKRWQMGEEKARELERLGRFVLDGDVVKLKIYSFEDKDTTSANPNTLFEYGSTDSAVRDLEGLLGEPELFSNPKPVELVSKLIELSTCGGNENIVLDFFAGSGTTGHALLQQSANDGVSRRYILVQLPEALSADNSDQNAAFKFCNQIKKPQTIAEITKERLRRAAAKVKADDPLFAGDTGFRVFKLDHSNIRAWNPNPADLEVTLFEHQDHLVEGRSETDVLYELLLKLGLDLCVPIEQRVIAGCEVHSVGGGVLLACLSEQISQEKVEPLAKGILDWHKKLAPAGDTTCVFRDSAFADDVAKTNLTEILEQSGIQNIRSL